MTSALASKECVPCKGGTARLEHDKIAEFYAMLGHDWKVTNDHHLEKEFKFKDFVEALGFTNIVGAIAEEQNHHPDILTTYGKTKVTIWTHKVDGLTESDFIFAAKVEEASQT